MSGTIAVIIQVLLFLFLPYWLMKISRKFKVDKIFSDILICYGLGILLGNTKQFWLLSWLSPEMAENIVSATANASHIAAYASVLLAIPLLLMLCNITEWLKYTGKITIVFLLGIISSIVVSITAGYFYNDSLAHIATSSGMLAGVYIGGTPNMLAVSKAVGADDQLFLLLNATDTLCSGIYFLFLLSLGKTLFGLLLPKFKSKLTKEKIDVENLQMVQLPFPPTEWKWSNIKPLIIATLLGIGAVLLSAIFAMAFPNINGELNQTILMLTLSTIGIALSFLPVVRNLKGVYNYAQYLLLIFGLAAGYMADFGNLISMGGEYLAFNAVVFIGIIGFHYLLSILFRIDTDSFIVGSTATVMGPPFIPQIASAIKNQELLPVGIALSILGLAIGNYAGIFVAWIVGLF